MKIATITLSAVLLIMISAIAWAAAHAHVSGYYTITFNFGDEAPPVKLSQVLPLSAPRKAINAVANGATKYVAPLPQRKPAVPARRLSTPELGGAPPTRNDLMPGDAGIGAP